MKIGLSYSRCVRDIVDGTVDMRDVLVVIARTDFDPHDDDQWNSIWLGYGGGNGGATSLWSMPEWGSYEKEDEQKFRDVSIKLHDSGKLHQPRKFGAHPTRMPYYWLEASIPAEEMESNPAVKKAWEQFQIVSGLANPKPMLKDNF